MAERRLYDAAAKGDEKALHELLQEDPFLLNRVSYTSPNKTPLHIATIHGHLPFVEQVLNQNPHLAEELDCQQSSALHSASAKGYVEIVKKLLSAAPDMCLSRDSLGRNPLHLAAIKGRVLVLEELFRAAPFAARGKVDGGLSLLHLCVEYSQFEALKILVPMMNELLNSKDDNSDTILHMAVRGKQIEAIEFLLTVAELEVNAVNLNGMTALDVLMRSRWDFGDSEIEESLKRAGALRASETCIPLNNNQNMQDYSWKRLFKNQDEWLEKKRSALMVVASLIATMAFQVGVNPPGSIWQDDKLIDSEGKPVNDPHHAGLSILAHNYPDGYTRFYIVNTASFIASLSIIFLLMSGLPIRRRFFMWILMIITWIAITAIALVYLGSIIFLTPNEIESFVYVIGTSVIVWLSLMALLLIVHTIRLIIKLVKKLGKILMRRQRRMAVGSALLVNNGGV